VASSAFILKDMFNLICVPVESEVKVLSNKYINNMSWIYTKCRDILIFPSILNTFDARAPFYNIAEAIAVLSLKPNCLQFNQI